MGFDTSRPAYKNALIFQRVLLEEVQKPTCTGAVKAQSARAYVELEKLKRVMRGLPANTSQSIRSESPRTKAKRRDSGPVFEYQEPPVKPSETTT